MFAAATVAWTWPLALHLTTAIPGDGGDNYSFLWNLWWMRHVLTTAGLPYFHTAFLFYPAGTTIADHPHTALPALVAATLLGPLDIVTAQNTLLLACVFANMASAYWLAWNVTRHRRAAVLAGVVFGMSPYLAAHLLGHYDLMAAWLLPAFALFFRRALDEGRGRAAAVAGLVLAATAYTAYYYVVYLGLFVFVYAIAWLDMVHLSWSRRAPTPAIRAVRTFLLALAAAFALLALWIVAAGGTEVRIGAIDVSARTPQNVLTAMWIAIAAFVLTIWRPSIVRTAIPVERWRRAVRAIAIVVGVFVVLAAPLVWQAIVLIARSTYVTPVYMWRSAPRGIDVVSLIAGPRAHPIVGTALAGIHEAAHIDRIEGVGWIGAIPAVLLLTWPRSSANRDTRAWTWVAVAFFVWALGPILTIAGFDSGLWLPETVVRFVPFAANARMPGRAMVGVFLGASVLLGVRIAGARGRLASASAQWLLIAVVAFEYWDSPVPLTSLDRPAVYETLAASPPGAVCEAPFGVGDGLSGGAGSQNRRILYYATLHEHPLVGGYIGRMPADAVQRYEDNPFTAALLRLSGNRPVLTHPAASDSAPCAYLVVDRQRSAPALLVFVDGLRAERLAESDDRTLYKLR